MSKKWHPEKPSSQKSRIELLEENQLLYKEVLASREAAAITADLVVQQFSRMEEINENFARLNDELKKISSLDGLTGVANRRFHDEMLGREWRRCRRNRQALTLVMIDIDYFKLYNDYYGHPAGDSCLKKVAKTLNGIINRPTDLLARYGGEEFIYTLSECDTDAAYTIAEKARIAIEDLKILHQNSPVSKFISISLGIASIIPKQAITYTMLSEKADKALYHAKESGRNCVKIYSGSH